MERFNKTIISKTPLKIVVGIYGLISTLWWWVFESLSHVRLLQTHELQPAWVLCPWDFPGNNTAVGSFSLLQGIFPTEGLNLRLLHCSQILYRLRYKGNSVALQPDSLQTEVQGKLCLIEVLGNLSCLFIHYMQHHLDIHNYKIH